MRIHFHLSYNVVFSYGFMMENPILEPAPGQEDVFNSLFSGKPYIVAQADDLFFHEAGVWMPRTKEWLVTSNRIGNACRIVALKMDGSYRFLSNLEEKVILANGGTSDGNGGAILLSQGIENQSGAMYHISADLTSCNLLAPTNPGPTLASSTYPPIQFFNSMNDIQLHNASGTYIFTDPAYGYLFQGFRTNHNNIPGLWHYTPSTNNFKLIDQDFRAPNGALLSPDQQTLYISDVWNSDWQSNPGEKSIKREVVQYDVIHNNNELSFTNRRVFVDFSSESMDLGYPDGLKCDERGNVYMGTGDGCRIYTSKGVHEKNVFLVWMCQNVIFFSHCCDYVCFLDLSREVADRVRLCKFVFWWGRW